jgi:hypothetical protein
VSQVSIIDIEGNNPQIPTQFDANSGFAIPLANVLNIVGGTQISTTGAGNTITINFTGSFIEWLVVTDADNPVNLTNGKGYIPKGAGQVQFILPPAAAVGDTFRILGYGNLYQISQNAGQSIKIGSAPATTVGILGFVVATKITDSLQIICVTANEEFYCDLIQGNPTVI